MCYMNLKIIGDARVFVRLYVHVCGHSVLGKVDPSRQAYSFEDQDTYRPVSSVHMRTCACVSASVFTCMLTKYTFSVQNLQICKHTDVNTVHTYTYKVSPPPQNMESCRMRLQLQFSITALNLPIVMTSKKNKSHSDTDLPLALKKISSFPKKKSKIDLSLILEHAYKWNSRRS